MIVGKQKPIDEIWDMVKDFKRSLYAAATPAWRSACRGEEAETIATLIRMQAAQEGKGMVVNFLLPRHRERNISNRTWTS
jgi:hypothetical protein